jgi:hypothetical protein
MAARYNENVFGIVLFGLLVVALVWGLASCAKREPSSKHPDQVLYERAMSALEHGRFDIARLTFKTLINTYPDSEWSEQGKLRLKDPRLPKCPTFGVGSGDDDCDARQTATQAQSLIAAGPTISRCPDPDLRQAEIGGDRITGVVLRQGKPVLAAQVTVYSSSAKIAWFGTTDNEGRFTSDKLASGIYSLDVGGWGRATVKLNPKLNTLNSIHWTLVLTADDGCLAAWGVG